jgi:hypothetical protein
MSKGKSVKDLMKSGFKSRFHTDGFSMFEDIPVHLKGPGLTTEAIGSEKIVSANLKPSSLRSLEFSKIEDTPKLEVTSKPEATSNTEVTNLQSSNPPNIEIQVTSKSEVTSNTEVTNLQSSNQPNIEIQATSKLEVTTKPEATSNTGVTILQSPNPPNIEIHATAKSEATSKSEVTPTLDATIEINPSTPINPSMIISNYTREPHFISAYLESADLSSRLSRVLRLVIRETIGWGREWACIPQQDIISRTKIAKGHISAVVRELEEKTLLLIRRQAGGRSFYSLSLQFFTSYMSQEEYRYWISKESSLTSNLEVTTTSGVTPESDARVTSKPEVSTHLQTRGNPSSVKSINFKELDPDFRVVKKELKKELNKSLSLSEIKTYFNGKYFSLIRAPKLEREEREAFNSIIKRNSDLSFEELQECFSVVESEHDSKGSPIKSKFVWMAKGLDRILIEARDNLAWRTQPEANSPSEPWQQDSDKPHFQEQSLTQEQEQTRVELLPEVKLSRSALIAAEKAYLENSDDDELKHKMSQCREQFERFLVSNEILLAPEIKRYTETEPKRFRDLIAAIEKFAFTGRVNLASEQAAIFRIIQEQQVDWYLKIKKTGQETVADRY